MLADTKGHLRERLYRGKPRRARPIRDRERLCVAVELSAGLPGLGRDSDDVMIPNETDALVVIDVQADFLPGGSLAVPDGDAVIPVVNRIAGRFRNVVLTQDWHPADHLSFASAHPGRQAFGTVTLPYGEQILWPDHCVQGTSGAAISTALCIPHSQLVIRKGFRREVDSYSAFVEADGATTTGLAGYLRERGVTRICLTGLATDYCVAFTALDGRKAGFDVMVAEDACRGIDIAGSVAAAWAKMERAGVRRLRSEDLA
jgi:nicotinamidase/pyrazinamidase